MKRHPLPVDLAPASITAICDSREQLPLDLAPLRVEVASLTTGDYSVKGLEQFVAIERKSEADLLMCIGQERDRFERELIRLRAYEVRAVVCETSWSALELAQWRSQITSKQAIGSVLGWIAWGIPFLLVGNHQRAGEFVARMLYQAARRRWREARMFVTHATQETAP